MLKNFNVFGSQTSNDLDIVINIPELNYKEIDLCQNYRKILAENLSRIYVYPADKIDVVPVKIENGFIKSSFIGIPDELNNSLFYTYDKHKQLFKRMVVEPVERNFWFKLIRQNRVVLTYFSRVPSLRKELKLVLKKGNNQERLDYIVHIFTRYDFTEYLLSIEKYKKIPLLDVSKKLTFQLNQTILLFNNIEVYTKEDIIVYLSKIEKGLIFRDIKEDRLNADYLQSDVISKYVNFLKGLPNIPEKYQNVFL